MRFWDDTSNGIIKPLREGMIIMGQKLLKSAQNREKAAKEVVELRKGLVKLAIKVLRDGAGTMYFCMGEWEEYIKLLNSSNETENVDKIIKMAGKYMSYDIVRNELTKTNKTITTNIRDITADKLLIFARCYQIKDKIPDEMQPSLYLPFFFRISTHSQPYHTDYIQPEDIRACSMRFIAILLRVSEANTDNIPDLYELRDKSVDEILTICVENAQRVKQRSGRK